jgi:heme-degrading monooxygenase HmoA
MTQLKFPHHLTTWTYFDVPEGSTIEEQVNQLMSARRTASGHRHSNLGRLLPPAPENRAVLLSVWESPAALAAFGRSMTNAALEGGGDSRSPSTVSTVADFGGIFSHYMNQKLLASRTQIRRIFFPVAAQLSDGSLSLLNWRQEIDRSLRNIAPSAQGHAGWSTPLGLVSWPYQTRPVRGWVVRPPEGVEASGHDEEMEEELMVERHQATNCAVLMVVMPWQSAETERKFLDTIKVPMFVQGPKDKTSILVGSAPVLEDWENSLRAIGAVGWTDEWINFTGRIS